MSNDKRQRELYDMRANSLRDKISELNAVERKGREEGEKNKAIEIAKNMKLNGLDSEMISKMTGLTIDLINQI